MLNIIIYIVTLALSFFIEQDEFISIEEVGMHDKLTPTLIISPTLIDNKLLNKYYVKEKFIVNTEVYDSLKNIIQSNKTNNPDSETIEFGCFEFAIHSGDKIILEYSTHRNESLKLFDKLIDLTQKNNEGSLLLEIIKMRKKFTINHSH